MDPRKGSLPVWRSCYVVRRPKVLVCRIHALTFAIKKKIGEEKLRNDEERGNGRWAARKR